MFPITLKRGNWSKVLDNPLAIPNNGYMSETATVNYRGYQIYPNAYTGMFDILRSGQKIDTSDYLSSAKLIIDGWQNCP
jgi:hypothetical protein